jgi:hypothetical protein
VRDAAHQIPIFILKRWHRGVYYQPNKVLDFETRKIALNSWLTQNYKIKDDEIKVALNLSVLL